MKGPFVASAVFVLGVGCSSTTVLAPVADAGTPIEAGAPDPVDAAPLAVDDAAPTDAGFCNNPGTPPDAAAATVFGSCLPHDVATDGVCIEYAGIGVAFAEATVKANCTGPQMGEWSKAKPCVRTNLAGGCRQVSLFTRLCETVVTYWYPASGDAGTTEPDVRKRCAAQGNADFVLP